MPTLHPASEVGWELCVQGREHDFSRVVDESDDLVNCFGCNGFDSTCLI